MLGEQLIVTGNVSIVEIGNAHVKNNLKNEGKIENGEIETIFCRTDHILHGSVNSKNPKRLYEEIEKKKKDKIGNKFSSHNIIQCNKGAKVREIG